MSDRVEFASNQTKHPESNETWSALPTVRDVLQLADALPEVLAGRDALDSPVRWVHVSESLGVAELLNGGELLLTTGAGWSADVSELNRYIDDLVRVGVAGLVVELVPRFDAVPRAVIDACDRRGFPLVRLHKVVKFVAVTEAVHSRIISEQTIALRARDELRELFTGLSLRGSPADFIVRQLSQALNAPVVLENLGHEVIAVEGAAEGDAAAGMLRNWEQRSRRAHAGAGRRSAGSRAGAASEGREDFATGQGEIPAGDELLVVPVEARGTRWGALIALPGEPHPAGRSAVLEQGAIALALGRLADRDGDEWLRISHQHLLDALLSRPVREFRRRDRAGGGRGVAGYRSHADRPRCRGPRPGSDRQSDPGRNRSGLQHRGSGHRRVGVERVRKTGRVPFVAVRCAIRRSAGGAVRARVGGLGSSG
jgi:purine catabolism regulator